MKRHRSAKDLIHHTGAKELDIAWPLKAEMTDAELSKFFHNKSVSETQRKYLNLEYIDKEMMRNGVTLKLLWK